ncbi:MAG: type II toxin-antitoxin system prevent-host-death family antitoxin [Longimicrobiales bacterium]
MRTVGIRELKNKLSHYIRLVEAGETVLVTNGGTVVAELCPPTPRAARPVPDGLEELARRGLATLGAPHDPSLYAPRPRVVPPGSVRQLLDEERGDR